jgi:hypothetical protein
MGGLAEREVSGLCNIIVIRAVAYEAGQVSWGSRSLSVSAAVSAQQVPSHLRDTRFPGVSASLCVRNSDML